MRILFMGSGDVACPALERLLGQSAYTVVAVVTQPDRPKGRNRKLSACPAKVLAEEGGLPVLTPERVGAPDAVEQIKALAPDIIVVAAYGQYIKPEILAIPPYEAINIHPSLLPKYRGASPIQWALANGEEETGVTILYVSKEMDAGDIIVQQPLAIDPEDTAATLTPRLAELGADLLIEALDAIKGGTAMRRPQRAADATLVHKLEKEDGRIDWTLPAETIHNRIRGFTPWPGCYTTCGGRLLKINKTNVSQESSSAVPGTVVRCHGDAPAVATGDGVLELLEVQPEGKKSMAGKAFLCGHVVQEGDRLGESDYCASQQE